MNEQWRITKANIKRMLMFVVVIALGAQICLNQPNSLFTFSLGSVCLSAILYLFDKVDPFSTAIVASIAIFLSRIPLHYMEYGSLDALIQYHGSELVFYFMYGLLLLILNKFRDFRKNLTFFIPGVMCVDFISNSIELNVRIQLGATLGLTEPVLLLVAFCRGIVLLFLLVCLDRYRIMMLSQTHAQRYQRLMLLISRLSGEIVWMDKNTAQIESTMTTAYNLYDHLNQNHPEVAPEALSIAKDIHEIKKEYLLIKRGLSQALENETSDDAMSMHELLQILAKSVENEFIDSPKKSTFTIELEDNLATRDPYLFLSVFHNLATNAMEANTGNDVQMHIHERRDGDQYRFSFQDNGPGIDPAYRNQIFSPRFSTKINFETGEIARGLGLPIVKDIIETQLGGELYLGTSNSGALFILNIPVTQLEVIA